MLYNDVRPVKFDDVVGQDMVRESIRNQSIADKFFGLYIFCGQFGGGKTTMARIVALAANCEHKDENGNPCLSCPSCRAILDASTPDIVEIDGASNNGVDKVRDLIASVDYRPLSLKKKVIVIDEVHMLSKAAFNALLKTLEEPPAYCIFVLCTTDEDAIPATVKSRAAIYRFRAISETVIEERLNVVCGGKNLIAEGEALSLLARYANGSMRNALSLLEQAALSGTVTPEGVLNLVGARNFKSCFELLVSVFNGELSVLSQKYAELSFGSCDFLAITDDCLSIITDALMYQYNADCVKNTAAYKHELSVLVSITDSVRLVQLSDVLLDLKTELKQYRSGNVFLLRLAKFCKDEDRIKNLEKRIADLEVLLQNGNFSVSEKTLGVEKEDAPVVDLLSSVVENDGFVSAKDEDSAIFSNDADCMQESDGFSSLLELSSESAAPVCDVLPDLEDEEDSDDMDIPSFMLFGRSFH